MKCSGMENISKLYQSGEADYFQRKAFEKHVAECPSCRKKYREVILLSALLLSSAKTAERNYLAETIGAYFLKGIFIAGIVAMFSIGGTMIVNDTIGKNAIKAKVNIAESKKANIEEPEMVPIQKAVETEKQNNTGSTIKIRAEDGSKSVNIEIDNDTMKINKRIENGTK